MCRSWWWWHLGSSLRWLSCETNIGAGRSSKHGGSRLSHQDVRTEAQRQFRFNACQKPKCRFPCATLMVRRTDAHVRTAAVVEGGRQPISSTSGEGLETAAIEWVWDHCTNHQKPLGNHCFLNLSFARCTMIFKGFFDVLVRRSRDLPHMTR